jgi:Holliday junction resolvasome RuvABC endonuclease subunit
VSFRAPKAMSRRALDHSFGLGMPGIPMTTPRPARSLIVLGVDPGATTGWALVKVSLSVSGSQWLAAGAEREPSNVLSVMRGSMLTAGERIELVAIETIGTVFPRARFGAGMAKDLARASRIGGELAGAAKVMGLTVAEVEAAAWRRALTGRGAPKDRLVKLALGMVIKLPARSNAHERDAAGVALHCARRALVNARLRFTEGP